MSAALRTIGCAFILVGCRPTTQPLAPASAPPPTPASQPTAAAPTEAARPEVEEVEPEGDQNADVCTPLVAPLERRAGDLTVHAPPKEATRTIPSRLRGHTEGSLAAGSPRVWVGPQVPGSTPLTEGTAELFILDHVPNGFLAFYRDPYGASSCTTGDPKNCEYFAKFFDICGDPVWSLALNPLLSRPDHLEIQDIRWFDGTLYFNEACQSYSKGAGGRCSALVSVDPKTGSVNWRTKSLVSNGEFLVEQDYIIAGYGFTAEKDNLFVVRRSDGKVVRERRLKTAPQRITRVSEDMIEVNVYPNRKLLFETAEWNGPKPRLVPVGDHNPTPKKNQRPPPRSR